jgi:nucleoside phosphorylase
VIQDLDPRWLLLVGIAGAVPDPEFTLGDVLLASRLHEFAISAALQDRRSKYEQTGGPMHSTVEKLLGAIPGWRERLDDWSSDAAVSLPKPEVAVPALDSEKLYGPADWKRDVRESLLKHFSPGGTGREPLFHIGPSAASSVLVKDADLLAQWQESARQLTHVEMEAGGAYAAARSSGDRQYPLLCIRGISDIVGFRRDPEWTTYAAQVAA